MRCRTNKKIMNSSLEKGYLALHARKNLHKVVWDLQVVSCHPTPGAESPAEERLIELSMSCALAFLP